ncbi:MerR family transcriptional regulator [Streptomyces sp. NPDC005438]|uniref:MerR family transcriptional regulator n=1 Tax=Streptomyces sp. NPDC005438 TaxID=3156880 RepID=UPI0033B1EBB6
MGRMRISQLAARCGLPATTLRFYEGAGLLPAERTPAGYRMYGEEAVDRLAFISAAKHLGLPLEEIGALLTVWESGSCREVRADLRPRLAARLEDARARSAELAAFTDSLRAALEHLDALPDRTDRCDPECGFLRASPSRPVDVAVVPHRSATTGTASDTERWRTAPVACSLSGDGLRQRVDRWREVLDGAERSPVDDGLRLTLPVERAASVAALAADEQACCPFFDFHLHLDGPALHLEVRAPAEGAAPLAELFGEPYGTPA